MSQVLQECLSSSSKVCLIQGFLCSLMWCFLFFFLIKTDQDNRVKKSKNQFSWPSFSNSINYHKLWFMPHESSYDHIIQWLELCGPFKAKVYVTLLAWTIFTDDNKKDYKYWNLFPKLVLCILLSMHFF